MKMKSLVLIFLGIITSFQLSSQTLGGEIVYKKLPPQYEYEIKIIIYTKLPSVSNYNAVEIFTGDGDSVIVTRSDSTVLCNNIMRNTYSFIHIYPNGTYIITFYDTNSIGIINFPNSTLFPFILQDTLDLNPFFAPHNSIQFNSDHIDKAEINKLFKYNLTAYDPNGDSLVYYLADLDYAANQYYLPAGFIINSLNGEIIWNKPDTIGRFQFKVTVQEWRNISGIPFRIATTDKIFSILVDTLHSDGQFLGISNWTTNANGDYESNVSPKTNFSVSLIYQDSLADSVDLFSYSETFLLNNASTFTTFSVPKQKIGFYNWTPDSSNIRNNPYIVTFRGKSYLDTVCHEQDLTLIIYIDTLFSAIAENNPSSQINIYPNPSTGIFTLQSPEKISEIEIVNVLGEEIYKSSVIGHPSSVINLSGKPSGIYFMRINSDNGTMSAKFIKY